MPIPWDSSGPRVLLINPPWLRRKGNVWREVGSCSPPIGLACLAADLERHDVAVRILDLDAERMLPDQIPRWLSTIAPPDFVGLSVNTGTIFGATAVSHNLRQALPRTKIIMGGVHPTVLTNDVLEQRLADYAVRGEGEITLRELALGAAPESVTGLSWTGEDGGIRHNPDRRELLDMKELPLPAYHLLPIARYRPAVGSYRRLPALSVVVSRGCPWRCTFCYGSMLGTRYRFLPADRILEELTLLKTRYGIREISFYDDTFTAHPEIGQLCQALIRQRMELTWSCFARADTVDQELLRLMKRAGCHQVMFGLESADERVLAAIDKRVSPAGVETAVRQARKAGLEVRVAVMFGSPEETADSLELTARTLERLNPDIIIANITTPYPGTAMHAWAKQQGVLRTENWEEYDLARCVMELPTVSTDLIERYYREIYRRFYFRPRYLWHRLTGLRSWSDIQRNARSFLAVWALRGGGR